MPEPASFDVIEEPRYNFRKRKASESADERQAKIIRAMLALVEEYDLGEEETSYLAAVGVLDIPIPKTYKEAVNDRKYGAQWKVAIEEELASLKANDTWREELPPRGTNLRIH
jgi:hypothetical protein